MANVRAKVSETYSIEDHARLIRQMIDKSVMDPECHRLARQIVSGTVDWIRDPRTGKAIPAVKFHNRWYRVSPNGEPPMICEQRNHTCEIIQIWNFLVLNVRYTGDADGYDVYSDLRTTLESGAGDCDDFSIAFCALLRCLGYACAIRIISQDGRSWAHVYPLVQHPQQGWVPLDATEKGKYPGWEFPAIAAKKDFLMSEAG